MRSYKQFCGIAKALDLVGERWTLLLIRELVPGGRRYTDLIAACAGITTNLLAKRLKHLEAHGIVQRRVLPPPSASTIYELTDVGRTLEPALLALGHFGAHFLEAPTAEDRTHFRWLGVSLTRRFGGPMRAFRIQLDFADSPLHLVHDGSFRVVDGHRPADVEVSGPALPLVLTGRAPLEAVQITGDADLFADFMQHLAPPLPGRG